MATEQTIYRVLAEMRVTFDGGKPTLAGLKEMLEHWLSKINAREVMPTLEGFAEDVDPGIFDHTGIFVRFEIEADERELDVSDIIISRN